MLCANNRVHYYPMVVLVCLYITVPHYHHHADLSESFEPLKWLSGKFCLECVSKIKSILSNIFHEIYGAVRIQLTHFSYDDCEIRVLYLDYHHRIWSITHLPLFRDRSWNNGIHCMSFYIFMISEDTRQAIALLIMSEDTCQTIALLMMFVCTSLLGHLWPSNHR